MFKVIAIASSAGGLKAMRQILSGLPRSFPAAILLLQHSSPDYPSYLAEILTSSTALPIKQVRTDDVIQPGVIYTAVPGKHLLVTPDATLAFSGAPRVKFSRPSADVLFQSLATSLKDRAIVVVLTGGDGDGSGGLLTIKQHGGIVIAQDEATSEHYSMPKKAFDTGQVDFVLPVEAIASTLIQLAGHDTPTKSRQPSF
jgi:two-component system chemotaxis response regulator CheB